MTTRFVILIIKLIPHNWRNTPLQQVMTTIWPLVVSGSRQGIGKTHRYSRWWQPPFISSDCGDERIGKTHRYSRWWQQAVISRGALRAVALAKHTVTAGDDNESSHSLRIILFSLAKHTVTAGDDNIITRLPSFISLIHWQNTPLQQVMTTHGPETVSTVLMLLAKHTVTAGDDNSLRHTYHKTHTSQLAKHTVTAGDDNAITIL